MGFSEIIYNAIQQVPAPWIFQIKTVLLHDYQLH